MPSRPVWGSRRVSACCNAGTYGGNTYRVVHKNSGIQRPAIVLWLRLFLRFAVEERILRGGADGDGVHLAASVEQIEALGGQAGGEHDTGVDTMVGGGGAGGADGNAYIDAIDGAGHTLGALAAGGKAAMGAVEALGLFVGANE